MKTQPTWTDTGHLIEPTGEPGKAAFLIFRIADMRRAAMLLTDARPIGTRPTYEQAIDMAREDAA